MDRKYQICLNCVMDTTDPDIYFDDKGVCNHCLEFAKSAEVGKFGNIEWLPNEFGSVRLTEIVNNIKKAMNNAIHSNINVHL